MGNMIPEFTLHTPETATKKASAFAVGTEVQFKKQPGVGYAVIDNVRNEHALRALDGSGLAMGLSHELEIYTDIEQEAFISKVAALLTPESPDFEVATSKHDARLLWNAGARFPEQMEVTTCLTDKEIVGLVFDVFGVLATRDGFKFSAEHRNVAENMVHQWRRGHRRIAPLVDAAIKIVDMCRSCESMDAIEEVYPSETDEGDF